MRRLVLWGAVLVLAAPASVQGQGARARPLPAVRVPIADLPFNALHGGEAPSMRQSLLLAGGSAQLAHHATFHLLEPLHPFFGKLLAVAAIGAMDLVVFQWTSIWLHEEWHRAVMSQRGIASFDDALIFKIENGSISVSHVRDADLVRLKAQHPAEMVRLHAAGLEADLELVRHLRKTALFESLDGRPDVIHAWLSVASVWGYRNLCASPSADATTDAFNRTDGPNVEVRDFTGLDCTAWAYDLFRPDEPYEARGVHPSGVGLDRYIRRSDLSAAEQSYLRVARNLGLLNLVAPNMLGLARFRATSPFDGERFEWNAGLVHHLTSYGQELSLDVLLKRGDLNLFLAYHHGMNGRGGFPGLEVEISRLPLRAGGQRLVVGAGLLLWLQPERQRFDADRATPGGLVRASVDLPLSRHVQAYLEADAKTAGWVAGVVQLEPALNVRGGVVLAL